jgi:RNA polymerase sigma factor (sigma-70 family)
VTDDRLLALMKAGDSAALGTLVERHWSPLVSWLVRTVGSSHDAASDSAQEAFCRLWERRNAWSDEGSLRALLFRLARNSAVTEHRRALARERAVRAVAASTGLFAAPTVAPERDELRGALARGIAALPRRRRQVFLLKRVHGWSHQQIARQMGTSPQTVANQLSHALATLRRELAHLRE